MPKPTVHIELWGVRRELESDFEGTLAKVAEIGYEYVQFYGNFGGKTAAEVRAILDKHDLKCVASHQGAYLEPERNAQAVAFLRELGVKFCAIPSWPIEKLRPDNPGFADTVRLFKELVALYRDNGIRLSYHNHEREFEKTADGSTLMDNLLAAIPELDFEIDTCWAKYAGADPAEYIKKYKGRVDIIHLKDYVPVEKSYKLCPVGHGIQDFPAILAAAERAGTKHIVVEQDNCDGDVFVAHKASRDYLKGLGY